MTGLSYITNRVILQINTMILELCICCMEAPLLYKTNYECIPSRHDQDIAIEQVITSYAET